MTSETPHPAQDRWSSMLSHLDGSPAGDQLTAQRLSRRRSHRARVGLTLAVAVVGAVALAAAIAWQGEQAAAQQRAASQWYSHTFDVLVEVGGFSAALSDIQGGARGYLLTADPQFLSIYREGVREAPERLRRVQVLTADNPAQQRRLADLASQVANIVSLSERMVDLEATGRHAAALALVRNRASEAAMGRAQATSAAVAAEEQRLLVLRRVAARQATSRSARIMIVVAFFGSVLLVAAAALGSVAFLASARARLAEQRAEAYERQAATAALLALFIAEAPAAIAVFDRQMRYLAVSQRYLADYGLPADTVLAGRSHYDVFPEIPQSWRDIHARVLAGETQSHEEDAFPRTDGRTDLIRWRMEPWRDARGEVGGALLFSEVITAEVEMRRAHRAAEARLQAIIETAVDAILVIDEAGVIQSANPATQTLFGYAVEELCGRNVSLLMPEPDRSAHDGYLAAYRKTGKRGIIGVGREVEGLRRDGSTVPIDLAVAEWRVDGRRFFTGLMRDISARKIMEAQRLQAERRELVVGELRHRISNMFAVIQNLVVASARSHDSVVAYRDAVVDRITAFAATQVELAGQSGPGLRELIEFELRPYAGEGRRILLDGEDLSLNGPAAESLAMVVHELATNAAKYGALSSANGMIDVHWRLTRVAAGEACFTFDWIEGGGPPVTPPQRRGFGSTVIENSARSLGGRAQLDYAPEGLRCRVDVPAAGVLLETRGGG
jgi:PAS domain S-box-containing protein